jgi:hypothetical protein
MIILKLLALVLIIADSENLILKMSWRLQWEPIFLWVPVARKGRYPGVKLDGEGKKTSPITSMYRVKAPSVGKDFSPRPSTPPFWGGSVDIIAG